jgi:MraZ protein
MKRQETGPGFLIGQFEGMVGAKSRTALPNKFRKILGDKLIITQGYEKSLIIVSQENWTTLVEGTEGRPFIQSETREIRRFLLGGAFDIELDDKGRFVIPAYLRNFGEIKDEVIFLGQDKYVEMWAKKRWDEYRVNLEKHIGVVSQTLAEGSIKKESERK